MKLIERLAQFIDYKEFSYLKFDRKISVSDGYIRKQVRNKATISSDVIENICAEFPELNPTWLITGNGEMLMKEEQASQALIAQLKENLAERAKIVQLQFDALEAKSNEIADLKNAIEDLKNL